MPFIPHTKSDIQTMLNTIGVSSIENLFDEIPQNIRTGKFKTIPDGLNEMELMRLMQTRADQDKLDFNFIGAGAYEHHIPAAVWDIVTRGEFMTAYTPYQAEASQGTLQLLYEYQTMMANLTGMEVSNASLYDGASGLAEAILMAVRLHKSSHKILILNSLNPNYKKTVKTLVSPQNIECIECTLENIKEHKNKDFAAIVISQPNFFGLLEDVDKLTDWAHENNSLVIAVVNPLSLAILKEPGKWGKTGADIVCGELQPFGIPLASGGPYAGFMCTKKEFIRQMPGRIVGATVDKENKRGFTLTLQAREQHIRRAKATSNICTNQGLLVTAVTVYLSLLGFEGLRRVATQCHSNAEYLYKKLLELNFIKPLFPDKPFFHEFAITLNKPIKNMAGYNLEKDFPEYKNSFLLCVTETKTKEDLDLFVENLAHGK
ncbi:MAG TPA: aminomethyl-transferring glycine dehydrogenase subunit GcvPA [Gammaproteobacteria bacterium]|nr:aminomethyl-transferring glycine dehydrogenase subunit GcvPA [Gammaproteobacteria bacterium]